MTDLNLSDVINQSPSSYLAEAGSEGKARFKVVKKNLLLIKQIDD